MASSFEIPPVLQGIVPPSHESALLDTRDPSNGRTDWQHALSTVPPLFPRKRLKLSNNK